MAIPVKKYRRRRVLNDESSPLLYYLRPVPRSYRTYNLRKIARRIEKIGALSAEDVFHVLNSFVREMKEVLTEGDKVKVDGFGIFHLTVNSTGVENEEDCNVRNIRKVNIRFKVDPMLRLVNQSRATTRGGENQVEFHLQTIVDADPGGKDDDDEEWEPIPDA